MDHKTPCQHAQSTKEIVDKMDTRLSASLDKVWEALDKVVEKYSNRPPIWATTTISILSAFLGGTIAGLLTAYFK